MGHLRGVGLVETNERVPVVNDITSYKLTQDQPLYGCTKTSQREVCYFIVSYFQLFLFYIYCDIIL